MIGREMTKQYETFVVGDASHVLSQLAETPKGEFVCIVEAAERVTGKFDQVHVVGALLQELSPTQAARPDGANLWRQEERDLRTRSAAQ